MFSRSRQARLVLALGVVVHVVGRDGRVVGLLLALRDDGGLRARRLGLQRHLAQAVDERADLVDGGDLAVHHALRRRLPDDHQGVGVLLLAVEQVVDAVAVSVARAAAGLAVPKLVGAQLRYDRYKIGSYCKPPRRRRRGASTALVAGGTCRRDAHGVVGLERLVADDLVPHRDAGALVGRVTAVELAAVGALQLLELALEVRHRQAEGGARVAHRGAWARARAQAIRLAREALAVGLLEVVRVLGGGGRHDGAAVVRGYIKRNYDRSRRE